MLKQALVTAATTAVLMVASSASPVDATPAGGAAGHTRGSASITGTWKGAVYGDDGGSAGYPAKVRIKDRNGTLKAKVVYPGSCKGRWKYQGTKGGWYRFREVITRDPGKRTCVSPVKVKTRREGKKLRVVWREPKTGDTGHMLAKPL